MSDQTKSRNAGGVDDIEEREDREDREDRVEVGKGVEDEDGRQAGGGRQSESDKPTSPDSRFGSEREG